MHSMLATRTNFSIGESILTVEKLVETAVAAGAKAVAITDTSSVTAMIDFTKTALKNGIKPIIGCRLRLVDDVSWRKTKDAKKAPLEVFLTYYVLSEKGLLTLFKLLTLANDENHYYFTPKISFDDLYTALNDLDSNDAAIASSDVYSVFHHKDVRNIIKKIVSTVSASNVFMTLTPIDTPLFDTLNKKACEMANLLGLQTLVTRPVYYEKGGADAAEVMGAIATNTELSSLWNKSTVFRDLHPLTEAEFFTETVAMAKRLNKRGLTSVGEQVKQGLLNTDRLVDMVKYQWKKSPISLPKMAPDEFAEVVRLAKLGWAKRFSSEIFGHRPSAADLATVYKDRLMYELSVLKTLDFSGYFLLVHDVVSYAKSVDILVGPGRGSVGGSLVAYLLGITDCDPIRFGLLFERFINPDRIDLPDADLDFMSERRHEIISYLIKKYSFNRVAGVSNFSKVGPASSIREVSKMFGLYERDFACSKLAPKEHGQSVELGEAAEQVMEIGKFRDDNPAIWQTCLSLQGVMRNLGQHAAGIVVGGCDLVERAVIEHRKGDEKVVCWDKRIVEDQGLVKMDILGLSTLDLIDLAAKYIKERHAKKINLLQIPLDDEKVLANFAQGLTTGVFQFESGGMRRLLREIAKGGDMTFEDITAATALYRPGPMDSGMMDSYYLRKQGEELVEYDHPLMEKTLNTTYGVMIYQEQIMQVSRDIAGYTMAGADKLRKIMGKKLPEEMAKERDKFVSGCISTVTMDKDKAGDLFDKIEKFAGYGFNRSHSIEYSLISYQCMWLKTNFPVEFFAAALTIMKDEKLPGLIAECSNMSISIELPDINLATDRFEILTDNKLMIPFARVNGFSTKAAVAIVAARKDGSGPFKNQADFINRIDKRLIHKGKVQILSDIGSFAAIEPTHAPVDSPSRIRFQIENVPGLVTGHVPVSREMQLGEVEVRKLHKLHLLMHQAVKEDGIPVQPYIGKNAQFMVVFDAPSIAEEKKNMILLSDKFDRPFALDRIKDAMDGPALSIEQGYWTALIKRPKAGKMISPDEIKIYRPFLIKELDLIKPPIIILMGSNAVRDFIPDFKGKASDAAGTIIYDAKLDANLVIGFSPGELYYNPEKQVNLDEIFLKVMTLL